MSLIRFDRAAAGASGLSGRIIDSTGRGLHHVQVSMRGYARGDSIRLVTTTDSLGAFTLEAPAGTYSVMARRIALEPHTWPEDIGAGRRVSVVVTMRASRIDLSSVVVCAPIEYPAIQLEVRDGVTGAPAADSVVATARDGAYVDTLRVNGWGANVRALSLAGAGGRAGVYEIRVTRPGYRDWRQAGIEVEGGQCGIATRQILVRLQPVR